MDFLPDQITSEKDSIDYIQWFLLNYYSCDSTNKNCFYGLNIVDPNFDVPMGYDRYFISFHTEYLSIEWIIQQANRVYPKPVLLVSDYDIKKHRLWPDNIKFSQVYTIHYQLANAVSVFDLNLTPKKPKLKLSSLSMRVTQYKNFVTSYLLEKFPREQMILSYYAWLCKDEDLHSTIPLDHLKDLDLNIAKTLVNTKDERNIINQSPLKNANWHVPAYTNTLFNLTNESWH